MSKHSLDQQTGRLLALGKKVSRIAESLAATPSNDRRYFPDEILSDAIQARRLRYRFFPPSLFGEPAWDMLLDLLHAQAEDRHVTVSNLCEAAGVVGTVALRWLSILESEGLVRRRPDPRDPTSEFIELEPNASAAFSRYFDELSNAR